MLLIIIPQLLGRCLARSLKDSRMLDLPISDLMSRGLLQEEEYFSFNDLQSLDSQLHRSLQQLKSLIHTNQTDSVEGTVLAAACNIHVFAVACN